MPGVFRFFDLPAELRNIVYEYALAIAGPIEFHYPRECFPIRGHPNPCRFRQSRPCTSLLYTCRQQNREASAILYAKTFNFSNVAILNSFLKNVGQQRRYLRSIHIEEWNFFKPSLRTINAQLSEAHNLQDLTLTVLYCDLVGVESGLPLMRKRYHARRWWSILKWWAVPYGQLKGDATAAINIVTIQARGFSEYQRIWGLPTPLTVSDELKQMASSVSEVQKKLRSRQRTHEGRYAY